MAARHDGRLLQPLFRERWLGHVGRRGGLRRLRGTLGNPLVRMHYARRHEANLRLLSFSPNAAREEIHVANPRAETPACIHLARGPRTDGRSVKVQLREHLPLLFHQLIAHVNQYGCKCFLTFGGGGGGRLVCQNKSSESPEGPIKRDEATRKFAAR